MASTTIKDGFGSGSDNQLKVNADGSINVTASSSTDTRMVTSETVGLSSFQTEQYIIGTSVLELTLVPLAGRSSISIRVGKDNLSAIWIGNSAQVTITSGYPLYAGDTLGMDLTDQKTIFAISDTPNQSLAVLEIA